MLSIVKRMIAAIACMFLHSPVEGAESIELLKRYPTSLTSGDTSGQRARVWHFGEKDLFTLSGFKMRIGDQLGLSFGEADLGIGRSRDGAVWAAAIPHGKALLASKATGKTENISHVWFRFHPSLVGQLFPANSVSKAVDTNAINNLRRIANRKMKSSWQANGRALIPDPHILTVDVGTAGGPRRFFVIDRKAGTVKYHAGFETQTVQLTPPFDPTLAGEAFDKLWNAFDKEYAMFGIRPDVNWIKLRDEYRPRALNAETTDEFAGICNDMLKSLKDLHVYVSVAGDILPGYSRPRPLNANSKAFRRLLPGLARMGREVHWTFADKKVGYLVVTGWSDPNTPKAVDLALEKLKDTAGLVLDVRLNGGGDERLARQVAGRFLTQEHTYAYHQFRNGPKHSDLGEKQARVVQPRRLWKYDEPVLLLIGQKCMSSTEGFVLMMTGAKNVTSFGDRTAGSSANPRTVQLPFGITVNLPLWIALQPDGKAFDSVGIEPDIKFEAKPGAFEGARDDLLSAALNRLARD